MSVNPGSPTLELGIGLKIETGQFPQPMVELAFDFVALTVIDPKLSHELLHRSSQEASGESVLCARQFVFPSPVVAGRN